jgi:hypothetical protein
MLAGNRSPQSYVAGGTSLHAHTSIRHSADVDVFHDAEDAVIRSSEVDVRTLRDAAFSIRQDIWTPTFRRAWVERAADAVKLEWCQDSAWRFFPIVPDRLLGWRLHRFDALTNKALAMGGRVETRDLVDLVSHANNDSLYAVIWAACAKDPGFTPTLLLNQMQRNSRIDPAQLQEMGADFQPTELKRHWIEISEIAGRELERAAAAGVEPGIAFVDSQDKIGWFDTPGFNPHRASLGGALPRVAGAHYEV